MSIRRSLALAGAAALASSMVLAGAQGAVAVGAASSPTAAAAAQNKGAHQNLDLAVKGVPNEFFAGGDAREFTFKIDNSTAHDFVLFPLLKLKSADGKLRAADFKLEYQLPKSSSWLTAGAAAGGGDGEDDASLMLLGDGDESGPADTALLRVNKGGSLTIKVRLSFTQKSPLGKAGVVPVAYFAQLDDQTHEPVGEGEFSCDRIKGAGFTIRAPKPGTPSPTASPSHTGKPTPTATPTQTATATPTQTATATPTSTATATPTTTAKPTETAKPTATPSASTSTSAAPAPATSTSDAAVQPVDFPVANPTVTPPKITPAAVAKAVTSDATTAGKDLAQTGGGSNTTPIALAGGAVLAAGIGTLVVVRRRKSAQQG